VADTGARIGDAVQLGGRSVGATCAIAVFDAFGVVDPELDVDVDVDADEQLVSPTASTAVTAINPTWRT
jgi:hypothetical protein